MSAGAGGFVVCGGYQDLVSARANPAATSDELLPSTVVEIRELLELRGQGARKGIHFSRALNFGITGPTQVFLDAGVNL